MMWDRLFGLIAIGYVYLMLWAVTTVFQRISRFWAVYGEQSARRYRVAAESCRERAETWTGRALRETNDRERIKCRQQADWFLSRAECNDAAARHHAREARLNRFLE